MTITDLEQCLDNISDNLRINDASAVVRELRWGENLSSFIDHYDYIIGADIIYIEETFNALAHTLKTLSSLQTKILISCKIRYEKDSNFLKTLENDFILKNVLYDTKLDIHVYLALKK